MWCRAWFTRVLEDHLFPSILINLIPESSIQMSVKTSPCVSVVLFWLFFHLLYQGKLKCLLLLGR